MSVTKEWSFKGHASNQGEISCVWRCECGYTNTEYSPFPMVAECAQCGKGVANYCTHGPLAEERP